MSKSRLALVAAAAAAAVALSACSTNAEPKPWPTAGAAAATSTETVAKPAYTWENVTDQGRVQRDDPVKGGDQWNPVPVPGIKIGRLSATDPSGTAKCTLGPAVAAGFLTAGHCSDGKPTEQYAQVHPDGSAPLDLGVSEPTAGIDAAVIKTQVSADATRIAGTWPVAGVLTSAGVRQLVPLGSFICFNGAISGVRCGERVADENEMLMYSAPSAHGDSGAPVFVVDGLTRSAALVGILSEGDDAGADRKSTAVYLDTALMATGTAVRLDPHTALFDAPQPGLFSQRISTE